MCWPTGGVSPPCHNGSLQRKKGTLLAHQLGTCHRPPFWCSSLPQSLDITAAPITEGRSHDDPALCHPQHPRRCSHLGREHLLFPTQNPQIHTAAPAAGTESRQPVSKNTAPANSKHGSPPHARTLAAWAGSRAPELAGERELATFILAGILQVPSPRQGFDSATQEERVFPGDTETCFHKPSLPLGAPWDGKMIVIWLRFRMPEPAGPAKGEKRD